MYIQQVAGMVAIDVLDKAPYWKTAWELDDKSTGVGTCASSVDDLSGMCLHCKARKLFNDHF